jgi:large subunit GTPase 1
LEQRQAWADYFEAAGIAYKFFSASLAKELNEARDLEDEDEESEEENMPRKAKAAGGISPAKNKQLDLKDEDEDEEGSEEDDDDEEDVEEESTRILTVDELENLFLEHAPDNQGNILPSILFSFPVS